MKNLYKRVFAILAIFIIATMSLSNLTGCSKKQQNVIKIGAILPLTGKIAWLGEGERNALNIAVKKINEKGGINGKKIKVIIEDSKGDPKEGASSANKLIQTDKVKILITSLSPISNVVQPIIEKNKVLQLAFCMDPDIADKSDYTFRIYPNMWQEAELMANFIEKKAYKKVGIIYIRIGSVEKEINGYLQPRIEKIGAKIVSQESFTFTDKDIRSQCLRIKESNPDVVIIMAYGQFWPMIFMGLNQAGLLGKVQILGNIGGAFELKVPSEYLENVVFVGPSYTIRKNIEHPFIKKYREEYGVEPAFDAAFMYDAFNVLLEAIRIAKCDDVNKVQQALKSIKNFEGVTGKIEILQNGDARVSMHLGIFKNGKRMPFEYE